MKTFLLWIGLGILPLLTSPPDTIWHNDYQQALRPAQESQRPIFMVFAGSDWCKPCIRLEKDVWASAEFRQWAQDRLVLLKLDFPRKKANQLSQEQRQQNGQLAMRYNAKGAFPWMVLVDPEGNILWQDGQLADGMHSLTNQLNPIIKGP